MSISKVSVGCIISVSKKSSLSGSVDVPPCIPPILAYVTALSAILAVVTESVANLTSVTLLSAILAVVTAFDANLTSVTAVSTNWRVLTPPSDIDNTLPDKVRPVPATESCPGAENW